MAPVHNTHALHACRAAQLLTIALVIPQDTYICAGIPLLYQSAVMINYACRFLQQRVTRMLMHGGSEHAMINAFEHVKLRHRLKHAFIRFMA